MILKLENGEKVRVRVAKKGEIYEYFIKDKKIGVYDPKVMEDNILMLQNTIDNEISSQIKDQINSADKEEIVEEAKLNSKIEDYASDLGIERVRDIVLVDLGKDKDEDKKSKKNEEYKKQERNTQPQKRYNESENTTTKDINVKQEINLSERANDMHDLRKWLDAKIPPEFTKMAVIESSQMSKMKGENGNSYKNNSTRYSLALVDKNNNIVPLQKYVSNLKQRDASGNNPTALKYQVDKDGNVEKDAILSEYEIGNKVLQIDNKEIGRIEVNVGQEEHGGNETMGVQMRDSNSTFATDTQTRRVMGEYESNGVYTVDENIKEAEKHKDCDNLTREDIDGDFSTKSHNHLEENIDYSKLAIKWGLYRDGVPDQEKAKELLEKEQKQNPNEEKEELIENITEEMEEEYRGNRGRI